MSIPTKTKLVTNKYYEKPRSRIRINVLVFSIMLMLLSLLTWTINQNSDIFPILIKQDQEVIHILSDKFLSFGLDSSLLRNVKNMPVDKDKFINLASHLSPAYVRIGGTAADCLFFTLNTTENKFLQDDERTVDANDITNFTLTSEDFLSLYKFSEKAKIRIIFDVNVLIRNDDGTWNSSNAKEIIIFAKGHEMELDWQLGNEPNSFFHVFNIRISAEQLAKDYCELRNILDESGFKESLLVGPEANHIGDRGEIYAQDFLNNENGCIDYLTWHQYYLNGHIAQVQDFINSEVFNKLPSQIDVIKEVIKSSRQKNISMWLSETSSAYGGGAPELSDRFVAGFLWIDKLGYGAKEGVQVIIRQSLFGNHYAMIGSDLEPNPDWWISVIYKKFVSEKVLNLGAPNNFGNLRLYAHCTSKKVLKDMPKSIVIYGVNLYDHESKIYIHGPPINSKIFSYILTSDNLQSRDIYMNGKILKLQSDGSLPSFEPKITDVNDVIVLPPYSIVFFLIDGMEVLGCLD